MHSKSKPLCTFCKTRQRSGNKRGHTLCDFTARREVAVSSLRLSGEHSNLVNGLFAIQHTSNIGPSKLWRYHPCVVFSTDQNTKILELFRDLRDTIARDAPLLLDIIPFECSNRE